MWSNAFILLSKSIGISKQEAALHLPPPTGAPSTPPLLLSKCPETSSSSAALLWDCLRTLSPLSDLNLQYNENVLECFTKNLPIRTIQFYWANNVSIFFVTFDDAKMRHCFRSCHDCACRRKMPQQLRTCVFDSIDTYELPFKWSLDKTTYLKTHDNNSTIRNK